MRIPQNFTLTVCLGPGPASCSDTDWMLQSPGHVAEFQMSSAADRSAMGSGLSGFGVRRVLGHTEALMLF